MDARKYWTMCRLHDWFYMMSDDPGVYREGCESEDHIMRLASSDPVRAEIFEAWRVHHYESGPVPEEPKLEE